MNKYWFKPKTYGYGYVPISVEGWIATIILILIGIFLACINNFFNFLKLDWMDGWVFLVEIIVIGFVFLKVFEKRCQGKLRWNWG